MPLVAPASSRDERADREEWLTNDPRCWADLDERTPGDEAEGQGGNWPSLHGKDALPWGASPAMERPAAGRSAETSSVKQNRFARTVDRFQPEHRDAFDGRWLHARGRFVDADSADSVSVPAAFAAAAGDIGGAGEDRMDMNSTYGTDYVRI